ncbi:MAG: hypothetical protein LKI53_04625 [Bacteroidales bacterium]|jgi:opacity protein-like surface antigen|nr:hypothetical protein [Bacteroidales bacterium]
MKKLSICILLSLCLANTNLFSQTKKSHEFFISPSIGINEAKGKTEYYTCGMTLGYYLSSEYRIDINYNYADARKRIPDYKNISSEAVFFTFPSEAINGKVITDFSVGAGLQQANGFSGQKDKNRFIVPYKMVLGYYISDTIGIALSGRYNLNGISNGTASLSLIIRL